MKSNVIPLEKMVISFICGMEITKNFNGSEVMKHLLNIDDDNIIFPAGSFWKISLDIKKENKVILQNCQDKTRKVIDYASLGKIFTMETDQIAIMNEEDVPVIINIF